MLVYVVSVIDYLLSSSPFIKCISTPIKIDDYSIKMQAIVSWQ